MIFDLRVYGRPSPKGSVQFARGVSFTPQKTRVAMHDLRMFTARYKADLKLECPSSPIFTTACRVTLIFSFLRPKSVKPKKRPHPSVKPDIDNLTKLVLDGLQPHILSDDCLVVRIEQSKIYGDEEFTDIFIEEMPLCSGL